jgi:peptidoglycan/xylan/chitin deacetylase (PgdA/CDA1 family)
MPIPILMYHVIADPPPATPNIGLWVRPQVFAAEMRALHRAGYWAIGLRQAWRAWTHGGPLPRKPVVVSFDDGYLGDYTHARPVLRRLGWPGVLNLELHNVRRGDLTARQVRALIADGWEVDSHTIDHPDLTTVGDARLAYELVASRHAIARRFGVVPEFFCYPYGRYDARVEAAAQRAGYLAATTEDPGYATATKPFALPRVRVQGTDTAASLLARLRAERPAA